MIKTYIEFHFPGALFSERDTREIRSRKPPIKIPEGAYGYHFFDRAAGKHRNQSGMHYVEGRVFAVPEIKKLKGDHKVLIRNLENNNWSHAIRCRTGNWQPFLRGDVIVDRRGFPGG